VFTDLVGWTGLSTKLDPEDLRSVIGAYHKCVAETVARFDGFVAGNYAAASALADEVVAVGEEKGAVFSKGVKERHRCVR